MEHGCEGLRAVAKLLEKTRQSFEWNVVKLAPSNNANQYHSMIYDHDLA